MKTKLHSLLLSVIFFLPLFYSSCYSQDFWEQLTLPDTAQLKCIDVNYQGDIFVGTGSNTTPGGVYQSTDGGYSWEYRGLGSRTVYSITVADTGTVYAGLSQGSWFGGLYRSMDNGITWDSILPDIGVYGNVVDI